MRGRADHRDGSEGDVSCQFCNFPDCNLPPCACGEDHASHPDGRCRDCDIQYCLDRMECGACKRMRYRTETPLGNFGEYLWGERCQCDPQTPSVAEQKAGTR